MKLAIALAVMLGLCASPTFAQQAATADASMQPLFETILEHVPAPIGDTEGPLQFQVSALDYSSYLGRLGIGRIRRGRMMPGQDVAVLRDVLAGGASRSLRADTQGKTLALALLTTYWFEPPADVSEMLRPRAGGAP